MTRTSRSQNCYILVYNKDIDSVLLLLSKEHEWRVPFVKPPDEGPWKMCKIAEELTKKYNLTDGYHFLDPARIVEACGRILECYEMESWSSFEERTPSLV